MAKKTNKKSTSKKRPSKKKIVSKKSTRSTGRYEPRKRKLDLGESETKKQAAPKASSEKQSDGISGAGRSWWIILIIIGIVIVATGAYLLMKDSFVDVNDPSTLAELHQQNLASGVNTSKAYTYHGFSIIKVGDLWYSQVKKGNSMFDVSFNFDPKDLEDIPVEGSLSESFLSADEFFITFDPEGQYLGEVAVANFGLSRSLVGAFGLKVHAGCLTNSTEDCADALIISCDDKDKQVFYFKESNETKVIFDDNCVTIQGEGENIIRAKDRLLLRWYGIMD